MSVGDDTLEIRLARAEAELAYLVQTADYCRRILDSQDPGASDGLEHDPPSPLVMGCRDLAGRIEGLRRAIARARP